MRQRLLIAIVVVLLGGLLLAQIVLAMSSTHYKLDWFTPLTGGGGGATSSTHYVVNFTIGQSAYDASASTSYKAGLGYWYGAAGSYRIYLPLLLK
jgi:hypothetical protein